MKPSTPLPPHRLRALQLESGDREIPADTPFDLILGAAGPTTITLPPPPPLNDLGSPRRLLLKAGAAGARIAGPLHESVRRILAPFEMVEIVGLPAHGQWWPLDLTLLLPLSLPAQPGAPPLSPTAADVVDRAAFPLTVDAAGSPRMCNAPTYRTTPLVVLSGGPAAHNGVIVGRPCRLVADASSPLCLTGVGEILPLPADHILEAEREPERWVVLLGDHSEFVPLFGMRVRIDYAPAGSST